MSKDTVTAPIAHVRPCAEGGYETQPLEEHLVGVAKLAERFARQITCRPELGRIGYLLGLLHDVGKYRKPFQDYIRAASGLDPKARPTIKAPHSPAGARFAYLLTEKESRWLSKVLSHCIMAHHRGLYDDVEYRNRLDDIGTKKAMEEVCAALDSTTEKALLQRAEKPAAVWEDFDEEDYPLLIRMLFSCLVDADFLDTEHFMDPTKYALRSGTRLTLEEMKDRLEEHMSHFATDGSINEARRYFLDCCRRHGRETRSGIYSLCLPTGAGKTLSSLSWALEHALTLGCDRVIYVIPYTSIITQTVETFRSIFGSDSVLEHHSDVDYSETEEEAYERRKLMTENWDAPLVVTTNVQFFESLYASRPGRCRKLHNICNSVVVFDEVQKFPTGLLNPMLRMIESLHYAFRMEPLLCTATLPIFDEDFTSKKRWGQQFYAFEEKVREVVPYERERFAPFDKVTYHWEPLKVSSKELAERLATEERFLCIVNSRKDALLLYTALQPLLKEPQSLIHLSRRMCSDHIAKKLKEVKERLRSGQPVRVISTQLVEAGVDLDFPVVYRAMAGLDSVMQAAGRCNREGRLPHPGDLYLIELTDGGRTKGELARAEEVLEDRLEQLAKSGTPERSDIEEYYRSFYKSVSSFDANGVADLLWCEDRCEALRFDYESASNGFRYIDDTSTQVIVPYGEGGVRLVQKLKCRIPLTRNDYRLLHRLTVGIHKQEYERLAAYCETTEEELIYLAYPVRYSDEVGIRIPDDTEDEETLIV